MSLPAPAAITSAPPAPSIVSLPAPPLSVFAADVPVILAACAALRPEPSTFSKFDTVVVSAEVWSALARFTVAATFSTSVSVLAPPSIEVSDPL